MDAPTYMQNTDSSFHEESLQILSAGEMGASFFFTSFAPASTADVGCALSIVSAPIFQSFLLHVRPDQVDSMNCQQQ